MNASINHQKHAGSARSAGSESDAAAEQLLGDLLNEVVERMSRGETVNLSDYERKYPEHADQIRQLMPTVKVIVNLGQSDDRKAQTAKIDACNDHKRLGDFRILQEIGRGGMGIVYEAEQISLGRSVALKVLPFAAVMDQKAITRFKNEARAAATLDHPHIVPVHAVGNERGVYYYAMSLVQGMTLADVIGELQQRVARSDADGERSLSIDDILSDKRATSDISSRDKASGYDETLVSHSEEAAQDAARSASQQTKLDVQAEISTHRTLFAPQYFRNTARLGMQAAEALDHAHQHGIVHRDIKPGNLMIDLGSNLWITDFGLARVESDPGMTATGDLIGTLRYMAPEQALANRVVVDHRADIYALGVTLYELLTLRPAYDGSNREELLHQIAFKEPKPPRQFNRSVPRDLETIVLKAIQKNPDERYASAQEMADDLRAFSDDEPIKARPLTIAQRTNRWAAKRKPLITAVAAILVLAIIALAVSNTMITQERNTAQEAERKERAQRQIAEQNFQQARATVDTYLTKVSEDELLNQPGMQPLRKDLLELALGYYERFAVQRSDDPAVQQDLADAQYRVGSIQAELGARQDSLDSHQQALKLREILVSQRPQDTDLRNELAESYRAVADQQLEMGRLDEASQSFPKAIAISQELAASHPDESGYQITLAEGHVGIASLQKRMGKFDQMIASHERVVEIWTALASQDKTHRESFAVAGIRLAEAYQDRRQALNQTAALTPGTSSEFRRMRPTAPTPMVDLTNDQSETLRLSSQAVTLLEQLVQEEPTISRQYRLANVHFRVGRLSSRANDYGMANYEKAHEILTRLVQASPSVPEYKYSLAICQNTLSSRHRVNSDWDESEAASKDAISALGLLVENYPTVTRYQRALGESYQQIGFNPGRFPGGIALRDYHRSVTLEDQIAAREKSVAIFGKLVRAQPNLIEDRKRLGDCYHELGALHRKNGNMNEALVPLQKSAEIREQVFLEQPWPKNQYAAAGAHTSLGLVYQRLGKVTEARESYQRGVASLEELVNQEALQAYRNALIGGYNLLTAIEEEQGNREQALAWCARAVEQEEKRFIRNDTFANQLAKEFETLASFQWAAGHEDEESSSYRRAILLHTYALEITPSTNLMMLRTIYLRRANAYRDSGQRAMAHADATAFLESLQALPVNQRKTAGFFGMLGEFLYRTGRYDEAREAIHKCIELRNETQPTIKGGMCWWYQTMLLARAGEKELAQSYYDQLSAEIEQLDNDRVAKQYDRRVRLEAAQLLGITPQPEPPVKSDASSASDDSDAKSSKERARFLAFLEQVIADKEQLIAQEPSPQYIYSDLVFQYGVMARAYSKAGDHAQAVATRKKAVTFCKERLAMATGEEPDLRQAAFYQTQLGGHYRQLSQSQQDAGEQDDARASLQLAEASKEELISYKLAIPKNERTFADWGFLGQSLYKAERYTEAREAFEMNLQLRRGKRSICPAWVGPTEWRRLPENVQVAVAGSLGVLQVFAQVIDRLYVAACFTFDARVAQVADQPLQLHASHPNSANHLILRPATKRRLQTA